MIDVFEKCREVSALLSAREDAKARETLILLLDEMERNQIERDQLVNHLVREVGLYPHIVDSTSLFEDLLVKDLFTVDIGGGKRRALHRDQSFLLKRLARGDSLVVSAPTSFGKSFVIDALISIRRPQNVMVVVPTIALADETRRRLAKKFARDYKIITTSEVALGPSNLFVMTAERAAGYFKDIESLDLLVVDEFYKVSPHYDKGRSLALMKVITTLKSKSRQCYFLAPNIDAVKDNPFTRGMEVVRFDLKTVVLRYHDDFLRIPKGNGGKLHRLQEILSLVKGQKTLIYVKSSNELTKVVDAILASCDEVAEDSKLRSFAAWFEENYTDQGNLAASAKHGILHHHGGIHRAVAQIVVRLYERCQEASLLLATSSLIEGVNTSAENVILWNNKRGRDKFDAFTYRNIAGRSGRMFKHFVGDVYTLEPPPDIYQQTFLDIEIPNESLQLFDNAESESFLTDEQIKAIKSKGNWIVEEYGGFFYRKVFLENSLMYISPDKLDNAVRTVRNNRHTLPMLLKSDSRAWAGALGDIIKWLYVDCHSEDERIRLISFIEFLPNNWTMSTREMIATMQKKFGIALKDYFDLEKDVVFPVASLIQDCNLINLALHPGDPDLSPYVKCLSRAFLPPRVYELEEYGLPRMLSKKIHASGLIDLESDTPIDSILDNFRACGREKLRKEVAGLNEFDNYVLDYFYEGIA